MDLKTRHKSIADTKQNLNIPAILIMPACTPYASQGKRLFGRFS